jgi:hypothetical protein
VSFLLGPGEEELLKYYIASHYPLDLKRVRCGLAYVDSYGGFSATARASLGMSFVPVTILQALYDDYQRYAVVINSAEPVLSGLATYVSRVFPPDIDIMVDYLVRESDCYRGLVGMRAEGFAFLGDRIPRSNQALAIFREITPKPGESEDRFRARLGIEEGRSAYRGLCEGFYEDYRRCQRAFEILREEIARRASAAAALASAPAAPHHAPPTAAEDPTRRLSDSSAESNYGNSQESLLQSRRASSSGVGTASAASLEDVATAAGALFKGGGALTGESGLRQRKVVVFSTDEG